MQAERPTTPITTVAALAAALGVLGAMTLLTACSGNHPPRAEWARDADNGSHATVRDEPATPAQAATESAPTPIEGVPVPEEGAVRELQPGEEVEADDLADDATVQTDAEAALHESMEAYHQADRQWKDGDTEAAFATLDRAYDRMVHVDEGDDAVLAQEKENLRNLISRRIVDIYAARQLGARGHDGEIPRIVNAEVEREIASFRGPERDYFLEGYQRSGQWRPMILAKLREAGLPEQLSWLPLIESWFKERALSRARALGMWQFIASTGYRYGLDRNAWIDERMDPEKSTDAAIAYLTALHDLFGDWMTALAAYNCGEHNVLKSINRQQEGYFDQFWDLYSRLPRETRRYVPRFLAALEILDDPAKYGMSLPTPLPAVEYETVQVARPVKLEALDHQLALDTGTLARLNPELRRNAVPSQSYELKVPPGSGATVLAKLDTLPKWEPPAVVVTDYRVRSGDTLSSIAVRFRTSVREIKAVNHLRSDRLSIGQRLQVLGRDTVVASVGGGRVSNGVYVVRSGDTLGSIAANQGVDLSKLMAANRLSGRSTIYPGQRLTIPD